MVAGQYSQAAGIDRQAFMENELCAEISHQVILAQPFRTVAAQWLLQVTVEGRQHTVEISQKNWIVRRCDQYFFVDSLEKGLRIVADLFPKLRIQPRKQLA